MQGAAQQASRTHGRRPTSQHRAAFAKGVGSIHAGSECAASSSPASAGDRSSRADNAARDLHQRRPRHLHLFKELALVRLLRREVQPRSELLHRRALGVGPLNSHKRRPTRWVWRCSLVESLARYRHIHVQGQRSTSPPLAVTARRQWNPLQIRSVSRRARALRRSTPSLVIAIKGSSQGRMQVHGGRSTHALRRTAVGLCRTNCRSTWASAVGDPFANLWGSCDKPCVTWLSLGGHNPPLGSP